MTRAILLPLVGLMLLAAGPASAQYQMTIRAEFTVPDVTLSPDGDTALSMTLKAPIAGPFLIVGFATREACEAFDPSTIFAGTTFDGLPVVATIVGTPSCGRTPGS